jgi:CHASE2 domain-containing sensor protein
VSDGRPGSNLTRALAYEVVVALWLSVAIGALAFILFGGRFQDLYLRLRPQAPISGQVAMVTIGDEELYLWDPTDPHPPVTPRGMLAEIVTFLHEAGARVIVLDVLLDQPATGDVALAAAAAAHGAVVGAEMFSITEPTSGLEFVAGASPTLGATLVPAIANLQVEEPLLFSGQMVVRRTPLLRKVARARLAQAWPLGLVGGEQTEATVLPSLGLAAAWLHQARTDDPNATAAPLFAALSDGCSGVPFRCSIDATTLGLAPLPVGLDGELDINFRGTERSDGIPVVRAAQILRVMGQSALMRSVGVAETAAIPTELRSVLRDRVVVVGRVDRIEDEAADRFVTPYSFPVMLHADMAGCRIHAQIIDTLLSGRHLREVGGAASWLAALAVSLLVVRTRRRVRDELHALGWLSACVALAIAGAVLFRLTDGLSVDLAPPIALSLLTLVAVHVWDWAQEGH